MITPMAGDAEFLNFFATLRSDQVALAALVTMMVVSILRGWVVPRSVLVDRMADKDKVIDGLTAERADLREAGVKKDETIRVLLESQSGLIKGGETTNRLIDTLRENAERQNRYSGEPRQIEGTHID